MRSTTLYLATIAGLFAVLLSHEPKGYCKTYRQLKFGYFGDYQKDPIDLAIENETITRTGHRKLDAWISAKKTILRVERKAQLLIKHADQIYDRKKAQKWRLFGKNAKIRARIRKMLTKDLKRIESQIKALSMQRERAITKANLIALQVDEKFGLRRVYDHWGLKYPDDPVRDLEEDEELEAFLDEESPFFTPPQSPPHRERPLESCVVSPPEGRGAPFQIEPQFGNIMPVLNHFQPHPMAGTHLFRELPPPSLHPIFGRRDTDPRLGERPRLGVPTHFGLSEGHSAEIPFHLLAPPPFPPGCFEEPELDDIMDQGRRRTTHVPPFHDEGPAHIPARTEFDESHPVQPHPELLSVIDKTHQGQWIHLEDESQEAVLSLLKILYDSDKREQLENYIQRQRQANGSLPLFSVTRSEDGDIQIGIRGIRNSEPQYTGLTLNAN